MNDTFDDSADDFVVTPVPEPPPLPPLSAQEKGDSLFWIFALLFGFLGAFVVLVGVMIGGIYYLLNQDQFTPPAQPPVTQQADGKPKGSETEKPDQQIANQINASTAQTEVTPKAENPEPFILTFDNAPSGVAAASLDQRSLQKVDVTPLGRLPDRLLNMEFDSTAEDPQLRYDLSPKNVFHVFFSFESLNGKVMSGTCIYTPTDESPLDAVAAAKDFDSGALAQGGGTGFIVHPDGIVATCAHVVENVPAITVTIGEKKLPAQLLSINHEKDLALLKINVAEAPYLALDVQQMPLGEPARVFGFPLTQQLGRSLKMSTGSVSGFDQTENGTRIQMDAVANPGNSGGPVTSNSGTVIGVVDSILAGSEVSNVSFAVPAKELAAELAALGVPYQSLHSNLPVGDPLLVGRLQEVSRAVVRVGHSDDLEERWKVVKYAISIGKESQVGKLLVDRSGNTVNLGDGLFASKALQDLTTLGFMPLPSSEKKLLEMEDAALLTTTVVEQSRSSTGNPALDLHRQMQEDMRRRMRGLGGIGGFGRMGIDPFGRSGGTTSTKTREVIQLAQWTDKMNLKEADTEQDERTIIWERETSMRELNSEASPAELDFSGEFKFDRKNQRLKSGFLKRSMKNKPGTSLTFSIQSDAEFLQQTQARAERQKQIAEETARKQAEIARKNSEQAERLDELQSTAAGLTKYQPNN